MTDQAKYFAGLSVISSNSYNEGGGISTPTYSFVDNSLRVIPELKR